MRYKIKNWHDYQHYKDRCPPWIKLHHSLLTNEVWVMGTDACRALVIASMLLASRNDDNDGTFNGNLEYVKRFAYLNTKPDFKPLLDNGFIEVVQDASTPLAECNTEKSREETEQSRAEKYIPPINGDLLKDWLEVRKAKRAGKLTETAFKGLQREAGLAGLSDEQAVKVCCERSWQSFKAEWYNKQPKSQNVQEARLDTARQIFGGQNGTNRQAFDIDSIRTIEGDGESIPKAIPRIR